MSLDTFFFYLTLVGCIGLVCFGIVHRKDAFCASTSIRACGASHSVAPAADAAKAPR